MKRNLYIITDGPRVYVEDHEQGEALVCFVSAREAHLCAIHHVEGGRAERITISEAKRIARSEGIHVLIIDGYREEFLAV